MDYQHRSVNGEEIALPNGKVVCVGRNYVDHVAELNNRIPSQPLLFIKPASSVCDASQPIKIPTQQGSCHNELEVAVLIGRKIDRQTCAASLRDAIWGLGLGLDLTLREVQSQLKQAGLPWERAKGFDGACPLTAFVPLSEVGGLDGLSFSLTVNHMLIQQGKSEMMLWDILSLLADIAQVFTLQPGDVVLTGTPKGVGPLNPQDSLQMQLANQQGQTLLNVTTQVEKGN